MTTIGINVTGQRVSIIKKPLLASGDKESVFVEATFDYEWDGYKKTGIFYQDEQNVYHALFNEKDRCMVPWEVLASEGDMFFGVFGINGSARKTSEVVRYLIKQGAWSEVIAPSDPTPNIYDAILSEVQAVKRLSEETASAEQEFEQKSEATLHDARSATAACYDAINALQLAWIDFDGMYPETAVSDNAHDMNGGYPSNMEV